MRPILIAHLLDRPDSAFFPPDTRRPPVVFFHSSDERGSQHDKVKKHGPPTHALEGDGLPCVLLAPQCPAMQWRNASTLITLIRKIAAEEKTTRHTTRG